MAYDPIPTRTSLDLNSASDINQLQANITWLLNNILPVGATIEWDNYGAIDMPDNYLYCNGQTVSDPDSPLNGKTLPLKSGYIVRIK